MISLQESHLIQRPSAMTTLLALLPPDSASFRLNQAPVTYLCAGTAGEVGRGSRSGALSSATNLPTSSTRADEPARSSTRRTIAEPTATPSARRPTAATCAGVLMPNPTHTGLVVARRSVR